MIRSAIFPHRYIQGAGALGELGKHLAPLGRSAIAVVDPGIADMMKPRLEGAVKGSITLHCIDFGGESTEAAMRAAAVEAERINAEMIIGVGGGKAIDTAKGAAYFHSAKVFIIPTICASDAPCSKNAGVYRQEHTVDRDIHGLFNPDIVLVDTEIIAKAPTRFLSAGIADALATWFEAESCMVTRHVNFTGYSSTLTAYAIAKLCYETLIASAPAAVEHCDLGIVTPQLEDVVEACTLMSTVGFESGGLASAHGFHQGLAELPETHRFMHGEKVAMGILASLFLTKKPTALIEAIFRFHIATRLPVCLADLNITDTSREHLMIAIDRMNQPVECTHWEPIRYSPEDHLAALLAADQYGRQIKEACCNG
ncbi:MAG: glycerol dehydrogenase [Planctomycetaceae bacterium]|nr:glycerol dehydrogenase [Planctomycetaceae bacterium]